MRAAVLSFLTLISLVSNADGYRPQVNPKEKLTTSDEPQQWIRTIYGTVQEIVTPTVIGGVTFSAKPAATPNPLQPWVSLEKDGRPKTIKPELKNGQTKKGVPDYTTYFQTPTLNVHTLANGEAFTETTHIPEDDTYVALNPVIRCTPNRYYNKGITKDITSAPFCTPEEGKDWKTGNTYFASWYTHYFRDEHSEEVIPKVRLHLSYAKATDDDVRHLKREVPAFFSTEWLDNLDGIYGFEVEEEWLGAETARKVVLSIQPSNVPDDEFDPIEAGIVLYIHRGAVVGKKTREEMELEAAGISSNKWWYVAITMPTVVIIALVFMYFFLVANNSARDFSDVSNRALSKRRRVLGKISDLKKFRHAKNHKYSELPNYKPSKQH